MLLVSLHSNSNESSPQIASNDPDNPSTWPTYSIWLTHRPVTGCHSTNTGLTGTSLVLNGMARPIPPELVLHPGIQLITKPDALHTQLLTLDYRERLICIWLV